MDSRQYTYEYRRPRPNNPTYISSNVNGSLAHYLNNPIAYPNRKPYQAEHPNGHIDNQEKYEMTPIAEPMHISKNRSSYLENSIKKDRYEEIVGDNVQQRFERQSSLPKIGEDRNPVVRAKANSILSNYGSNVLSNAGDLYKGSIYNDQEVYKKQEKKFNIITLKPNSYNQTIRQYPKLTLEDKDAYFYRKLQQQQLFQEQQNQLRQMDSVNKQSQPQWQSIDLDSKHEKGAGKPTFTHSSVPYAGNRNHPNAKALNNLDQLDHI